MCVRPSLSGALFSLVTHQETPVLLFEFFLVFRLPQDSKSNFPVKWVAVRSLGVCFICPLEGYITVCVFPEDGELNLNWILLSQERALPLLQGCMLYGFCITGTGSRHFSLVFEGLAADTQVISSNANAFNLSLCITMHSYTHV